MFVVRFVIAPSSQELEPPTIPGRFTISSITDIGYISNENPYGFFNIPFIVRPSNHHPKKLALLVNTNTWVAYNSYSGKSRYRSIDRDQSRPKTPENGVAVSDSVRKGPIDLTYFQPNLMAAVGFPCNNTDGQVDVDSDSMPGQKCRTYSYYYLSNTLLRGELWVINWLKENHYNVHLYTDLDLDAGRIPIHLYKGLILSTHPEYWSIRMFDRVKRYLDKGGSVITLGGNAIFDRAEISENSGTMRVFGYDDICPRLQELDRLGYGSEKIIGLANSGTPATSAGFKILCRHHPIFEGIPQNVDSFGDIGWNLSKPQENQGPSQGGGSAVEVNYASASLVNSLIAKGTNSKDPGDVIYLTAPAGGIIFSIGSVAFGGTLPVDRYSQIVVKNVLKAVLAR